ncbi:MAG: arginine--tRNA ligase [Bacteroidota bacterium]
MIATKESIQEKIKADVFSLIPQVFGEGVTQEHIQIQKTKKEFEGQFTIVVFPFTKLLRKKPEDIGHDLGSALAEHAGYVKAFNVVKGFLNLEIDSNYWLDFVLNAEQEEQYGFATANSKPLVMVEFASPNTNKPLHLGHLRNIFLGNAVAQILEAAGHEVKKVQIINDRGIHICKSMLAWQEFGQGENPESSGIKGDKFVGKYYVKFNDWYKDEMSKLIESGMSEEEAKEKAFPIVKAREMLVQWEQKDPEVYGLWEKMNSWCYDGFAVTYKTMGVEFDHLYYESNTYLKGKEEVDKGLAREILYQKEDGSVWIDLSNEGLDNKLLLRSDGTAVYMTQDIGTAIQRFSDYPRLHNQIYTVGNEQEYHFKVLFKILQKFGFERAADNYHLSYGMVDLPEGKMKSREGTVVDADDIMSEMQVTAKEMAEESGKLDDITEENQQEIFRILGLGALKYFLLKVDPVKRIVFDPKASIDFNGNTGPFIQYTYTRIQSLLRNFGGRIEQPITDNVELGKIELEIIQLLHEWPALLKESAEKYNPAMIANHIYELVKTYNSFYQSSYILKEENNDQKLFWLLLSNLTGKTILNSMRLLGIEMPARM